MNGSIATDLSNLTGSELIEKGIANLWEDGMEATYGIRHGGPPVSDFGRDMDGRYHSLNFFERAFPCLYPYGQGGVEAARPV